MADCAEYPGEDPEWAIGAPKPNISGTDAHRTAGAARSAFGVQLQC